MKEGGRYTPHPFYCLFTRDSYVRHNKVSSRAEIPPQYTAERIVVEITGQAG